MCGITGIIDRQPPGPDVLEAMRDTLRHRGPDDAGTWWSSDRRVALAHRRLSIIDLSPAGHQPMADPQGDLALVYNGEIYNFQDLRQQLEGLGHVFGSTCDTEVLLAAYRQWGLDAVEKLHGMFAFAIYDGRAGRVVLARDRAGEKPLYYRPTPGGLRFASEIKALLAEPGCPRRIDRVALEEYLAYGYVPGELCMLEGFRKLPQGHLAVYDLATDALGVRAYWSLPVGPPPAEDTANVDALIEELHELLCDSVRRQLVADVPVGVLLSGGVDSSLVTAAAAEVSAAPIKTFTIAFPGHGPYDESAYARQVAEHFGTDHTELVAEPATVELLPQLAAQYDEPMADSSMVPTFMVSRLIRQHATVALGGDGGDELFGGYPFHQLIQRAAPLRAVPACLRGALRALADRVRPPGKHGRNAVLAALADLPDAAAQINKFFDPRHRDAVLAPSLRPRTAEIRLAPEARRLANQQPFENALQRMTAMDFRTYLADDILVKVDRASMLTSLEVRAPLLDPRLIEFAFGRVPANLRATSREKKILTRRLAARLLPASMDLTRKQGFSLPLQDWFAGPWGEFCEATLAEADERLLSRSAVGTLLAQQRAGRRHTQRLFALTMLELWRRHYDIQPPEMECER
jgi:asparagine synthase (glutamine-hydrolysing)